MIAVAHLFPVLHARLLDLLGALNDSDWKRPTVAGAWTVKDVAAHLLDTQQRQLSRIRGEPSPPPPPIRSHADLAAWINQLNAEGISRYSRLEPAQLIALLADGAPVCADHYSSLNPVADAVFPVSWAGDTTSPNWFHVAREFTERWHHQQQIRLATGREGIMTPELYHPVLDCFMRALPLAFGDTNRPPGALVCVRVTGDCGGRWYVRRDSDVDGEADKASGGSALRIGWRLTGTPEGRRAAETTIPQEIAWRIFTKGIGREQAAREVHVEGDADLGYQVLNALAIVG